DDVDAEQGASGGDGPQDPPPGSGGPAQRALQIAPADPHAGEEAEREETDHAPVTNRDEQVGLGPPGLAPSVGGGSPRPSPPIGVGRPGPERAPVRGPGLLRARDDHLVFDPRSGCRTLLIPPELLNLDRASPGPGQVGRALEARGQPEPPQWTHD